MNFWCVLYIVDDYENTHMCECRYYSSWCICYF